MHKRIPEAWLNALCSGFLDQAGVSGLWTPVGPTPEAQRLFFRGHKTRQLLTADQHTLLRLAFELWGRDGACTVNALLELQELRSFALVAALFQSIADTLDLSAAGGGS